MSPRHSFHRWSQEENAFLATLCRRRNNDWPIIVSRFNHEFGTKFTKSQCCAHWHNTVLPSLKNLTYTRAALSPLSFFTQSKRNTTLSKPPFVVKLKCTTPLTAPAPDPRPDTPFVVELEHSNVLAAQETPTAPEISFIVKSESADSSTEQEMVTDPGTPLIDELEDSDSVAIPPECSFVVEFEPLIGQASTCNLPTLDEVLFRIEWCEDMIEEAHDSYSPLCRP